MLVKQWASDHLLKHMGGPALFGHSMGYKQMPVEQIGLSHCCCMLAGSCIGIDKVK